MASLVASKGAATSLGSPLRVLLETRGFWIHFKMRRSVSFERVETFYLFRFNLFQLLPEKQSERIIFTPARTQIRNRFLSWTGSNQQKKVRKENRQTRSVPSEKGLALKGRNADVGDFVAGPVRQPFQAAFQATVLAALVAVSPGVL